MGHLFRYPVLMVLVVLFSGCGGDDLYMVNAEGETGKSETLSPTYEAGELIAPALGQTVMSFDRKGKNNFCTRRASADQCSGERSMFSDHHWQIDIRQTGILTVAITTSGSFEPYLSASYRYTQDDGSVFSTQKHAINAALRETDAEAGRYEIVILLPPKRAWFRLDEEDSYIEYLDLYISTEGQEPPPSSAAYEIELLEMKGQLLEGVQYYAGGKQVTVPSGEDYLELSFDEYTSLHLQPDRGAYISEVRMEVAPPTSEPSLREIPNDTMVHHERDVFGGIISTWQPKFFEKLVTVMFYEDQNISWKETARVTRAELHGIPGAILVDDLQAFDFRFYYNGWPKLLDLDGLQ